MENPLVVNKLVTFSCLALFRLLCANDVHLADFDLAEHKVYSLQLAENDLLHLIVTKGLLVVIRQSETPYTQSSPFQTK